MSDLGTGLTGPWLASRLGIDPVALEAQRRAGEIFAIRPEGSADWVYPSWQFDSNLSLRPEVERVLAAAREAGLRGPPFADLLHRRVGLAGGETMLDRLLAGDEAPILRAISSERAGASATARG